jgi:glyoxylase-like metal-dependent hydrolase (beta-lactamase superfamily II)
MTNLPHTKSIGEFAITAVSDGILNSNHDVILGIERSESERLTGVPYGQPVRLDVNCVLIRHRDKLILSDAGSGHTMGPTLGRLPKNLRAIGVAPESIDILLLTHLHPDHSLGLVDEQGRAVFPKAEIMVHEIEAEFWLDRALQPDDSERVIRNATAQRTVTAPYRERIRRIKDGEVLPGITAMLRPGHTPGHTNWLVQSGNDRLLLWGDIIHLAAVQLARPDATLVFDVAPDTARATREQVLDWVERERLCVAGAHLPFPGFGRIERSGTAYSYRADG